MGLRTAENSLVNMTGAKLSERMKPNPTAASTPNVVQAESVKVPKTNSVGNQASRQSLNNMGFNDADIGWDGSRVTYKGQGIVQPASVEDGVSYAPESVNYAGAVDWLKNNGYQGIRQGLNDRGVTDVGWDNGYVTVDGQRIAKPQYNVDGTTYGTEDEINAIARQAYANGGNNLVAARDYATSKNYGGIVDWDGENVLIGGQAIKPVYVKDGTAYITRSDADRLIGAFENNSGITGNQRVLEEHNKKYGTPQDAALARLLNRKEFSWNPETDESWQRHKEQQMELADDAYRRVLEENNTSVTGASGAVLSEAMAAKDNYLGRLAEDEMEWRKNAYDEYAGETDRLRNQFADLYYAANDAYNKRYQANRDSYNDSRTAMLDNRDEEWTWRDYERNLLRDSYEYGSLDIANQQAAFNYRMAVASERGEFTLEDEAYIPGLSKYRNPDGTYSIKPWSAENQYNYDSSYFNALGQYKAYNDANK